MTALANPGVPAEVRAQGEAIANQAIVVVSTELARLQSQPNVSLTPITNNQPSDTTNNSTGTNMTEAQPEAEAAPASQARIEIISTNPKTPLDGNYFSYQSALASSNPSNYIEIGAVLYNDEGENIRDAEMAITTSDPEQGKVKNGTSTFHQKKFVYGIRYDFKTAGEHTITFSANGITESIVITAK